MAFYTEERLNENRVFTDADFNVGFADYLGATIRDAWNDNPTVAVADLWDVQRAQIGDEAVAGLLDQRDDLSIDVSDFEYTASPALSLEDQQARIKEAGLEKHIKAQEGYNAEALDLIMGRKREELERQITRQSASDWYAPAGFIAGLGTSMLDPINVASNFIPGVGQTRALRMLQEGAKEGAKGLALRRAVIGAAEGAAGSVVVEPLVAFARSQQQADYGMTDSLLNVAFGTVMGATIHPAVGAWGDYKRRQAQKKNPFITAPWEVVPPTDKTEALRHQFAQDALAKAREAGASMTEEQAYASAALFDARARTVAYFENIDPEEYYKRHRPEFEAELERMGELEQGMYRNKADVPTFIENARNGMYDAHPSYVGMGEIIGGGHRFDGFELQLFSDNAKHTAKHEDNWENTLDIVSSGEFYDLKAKARTTGNDSFLYYKRREDGKIDAVVVSPRSEKNKTLAVISSWKTNENGIEAVVQRAEEVSKRKAASAQPTGGSPAYPSQQRGALTGTETTFDSPSQTDAYILTGRGDETPQGLPTGYEEPFSEANIPQTDGDINTLRQIIGEKGAARLDRAPEMPDAETPRGSVTFRPEDGKAVITFFKNTDASTLPHEMFHIFRRELAETAGMEGSSPQSRDMWAKVCEFVGAKEGEKWTVEQEEMFARAGERYLLEGKAPNAQLRGVFERMKQWFMEIYTSVDAAGMEISDTMRQVFGDMFKLSPEEADMAFRYGFGKMLEWDGTEGTDTAIPELPESDDPAMQEELTGLAVQRLEESLQSVADRPEFAEAVRKQVEQEIAELDAEMAQAKIQGDVLLEAALCDMRN